MKKTIVIVAFSLGVIAGFSQTTPPAELPHQTFLNSVTAYFSSFNTNLDSIFVTHKGDLWAGPNWQGGAHASTSLGLDYDVYKKLSFGSETRFEDITGNVGSQQFSLGYGIVVHDVKLTGLVGGAWGFKESKLRPLVGVSAKKLMTEHTFTAIGLDIPFVKNTKPELKLSTGLVF